MPELRLTAIAIDQPVSLAASPVGAESRVTLCHPEILTDQSAEAIQGRTRDIAAFAWMGYSIYLVTEMRAYFPFLNAQADNHHECRNHADRRATCAVINRTLALSATENNGLSAYLCADRQTENALICRYRRTVRTPRLSTFLRKRLAHGFTKRFRGDARAIAGVRGDARSCRIALVCAGQSADGRPCWPGLTCRARVGLSRRSIQIGERRRAAGADRLCAGRSPACQRWASRRQ
jgi:hypothetical protein